MSVKNILMKERGYSMNVAKVISNLVDRLIKEWGYVPTQEEIMQAYTDGELMLSDNEEDILASMIK